MCLCGSGEKIMSVAAVVIKRVEQGGDDALIHEGQHLRYRHDIMKMNALNASIVYSISFI